MRRRARNMLIPVVVVVAVVLGVGVMTYVFGGSFGKKPAEPTTAEHALSFLTAPPELPVKRVAQLTLPWDDERGIAVSDGLSSLESVFAGENGDVYVVDHVPTHIGARVRRYQGAEKVAQHLAPAGSLLFRRLRNGFGYVIAKGQQESQQVVLVREDGSIEETYTIPLGVNSGGLYENGDTLYSIASSSWLDPDTKEVTGSDVLIPVAVDGVQVTDEQATRGTIEAWRIAGDSEAWRHEVRSSPSAEDPDDVSRTLARGTDVLSVPFEAVPLGIDSAGRAWIALPPHKVGARAVAGWPALTDEYSLIAAVTAEGRVVGAMPVRSSANVYFPDINLSRRFGFDGTFLTVADSRTDGVLVTAYEVTR